MKLTKRVVSCKFCFIISAFIVFSSIPAQAGDKYWNSGNGTWDESYRWNPQGVPVTADNVYLLQSGNTDITVTYRNQNPSVNPVLNTLEIDATGLGKMTLAQPKNTFLTQNEYIGKNGTGNYYQTSGMNKASGNIYLGQNPGSNGSYLLEYGNLSVSNLYVGNSGKGNLNQIKGSNNISNNFYLGYGANSSGSVSLGNGSLYAKNEYIGYGGSGSFLQNGGLHTVSGNVFVGSNPGSSGTMVLNSGWAEVSGNVSIKEGSLLEITGDSSLIASTIYNEGTFNFKNNGTFDSMVSNFGSMNISNEHAGMAGRITNGDGGINPGSLIVTQSEITPEERLINNLGSSVQANNSTIHYLSGLTNNSAYISNSSLNEFVGDLIIGNNGYLASGSGDTFDIKSGFDNNSTQNVLWNTSESALTFSNGGYHTLSINGVDLGALMDGYKNNFAWGSLYLDSSASLEMYDNDSIHGGAIYVRDFLLGGGIGRLKDAIISNGMNIYYRADSEKNDYLEDKTYTMVGGGVLAPVFATPEPSVFLLLGLGSALLGFKKSLFKKEK